MASIHMLKIKSLRTIDELIMFKNVMDETYGSSEQYGYQVLKYLLMFMVKLRR